MTKFGKTSMTQHKLAMSSYLDLSLEILFLLHKSVNFERNKLRDAILNQNSAHKFKPVLINLSHHKVCTHFL